MTDAATRQRLGGYLRLTGAIRPATISLAPRDRLPLALRGTSALYPMISITPALLVRGDIRAKLAQQAAMKPRGKK